MIVRRTLILFPAFGMTGNLVTGCSGIFENRPLMVAFNSASENSASPRIEVTKYVSSFFPVGMPVLDVLDLLQRSDFKVTERRLGETWDFQDVDRFFRADHNKRLYSSFPFSRENWRILIGTRGDRLEQMSSWIFRLI